jgi:hypothetical protein
MSKRPRFTTQDLSVVPFHTCTVHLIHSHRIFHHAFAVCQVVDVRPVHVGTDLIDIGINLAHKNYTKDFSDVLARAMGARVTQSIITGVSLESSKSAIALANAHPKVLFATGMLGPPQSTSVHCLLWFLLKFSSCSCVAIGLVILHLAVPWHALLTVGVHPHDAETVLNQAADRSEEVLFQKLCALVDSHRVVNSSSASAAAAASSSPIPCVVAIGECGCVERMINIYVCMFACMFVCVYVCLHVCQFLRKDYVLVCECSHGSPPASLP